MSSLWESNRKQNVSFLVQYGWAFSVLVVSVQVLLQPLLIVFIIRLPEAICVSDLDQGQDGHP